MEVGGVITLAPLEEEEGEELEENEVPLRRRGRLCRVHIFLLPFLMSCHEGSCGKGTGTPLWRQGTAVVRRSAGRG